MEKMSGYPLGIQDFKTVRENSYIYIDKTRYIGELLSKKTQYCFLARPRRFGKSLFLSTLRYFFEGKRDLFKGLYIDAFDWDWEAYPVLRLDLNTDSYKEQGRLDSVFENAFRQWETEYEVKDGLFKVLLPQ